MVIFRILIFFAGLLLWLSQDIFCFDQKSLVVANALWLSPGWQVDLSTDNSNLKTGQIQISSVQRLPHVQNSPFLILRLL